MPFTLLHSRQRKDKAKPLSLLHPLLKEKDKNRTAVSSIQLKTHPYSFPSVSPPIHHYLSTGPPNPLETPQRVLPYPIEILGDLENKFTIKLVVLASKPHNSRC